MIARFASSRQFNHKLGIFHAARRFASSSSKNVIGTTTTTATGMLAWYSRKLDSHPITTKSLSAGIISGAGDVLCQWLVDREELVIAKLNNNEEPPSSLLWWWDGERTSRFVILGIALVGPILHKWYTYLAVQLLPGTANATVVKRVFLDQVVAAPAFLCLWTTSFWNLEQLQNKDKPSTSEIGTNEKSIPERLISELPGIVVANWMLWIPAQAANFKFIPTKFQVLFSNFVALAWNTYLSFSTRQKIVNKQDESNN